MVNNIHIIAKQTIDLNLRSSAHAFDIQNKFKDAYYDKIVPLMEAMFSQMEINDKSVRIDRLELDLGSIHIDELETKIADKFKLALDEKLNEVKFKQSMSSYQWLQADEVHTIKKEKDSNFDLLRHFLLNGTLPWWTSLSRREQLPEMFLREISLGASPLIDFIKTNIPRREFAQRLVFQFTDEILETLTQSVFRNATSVTFEAVKKTIMLFERLKPILPIQIHIRLLVWQTVWKQAEMLNPDSTSLSAGLLLSISRERNIPLSTLFLEATHDFTSIKNIDGNSENIEVLKQIFLKFLRDHSFSLKNNVHGKEVRELISIARNLKVFPHKLRWKRDQEEFIQLRNNSGLTDGIQDPLARKIIDELRQLSSSGELLTKPSQRRNSSAGKTLQMTNSTTKSKKNQNMQNLELESISPNHGSVETPQNIWPWGHDSAEVEKVYLENAGLILFSSFLPQLFEQIGLVVKSNFVDKTSTQRAIHILHYLSYGRTFGIEYEMPLNKLLCGLNVIDSVDCFIELSDREKQEADSLLQSVITHWSALKHTSVNGFRNMFLLRNGILSQQEFGWRLQVERNSYDILLDRLPWSFSTVRLPWMKTILSTEW